MYLLFERPDGCFKSNCNILALAWMPYYVEIKFRQALFEYHQKQLINLANPGHSHRSSTEQSAAGQQPSEPQTNRSHLVNSRVVELYQRYIYMKIGNQQDRSDERTGSGPVISSKLDAKYGRVADFGWLVIGNVGKIVGITLTSTVQQPQELDGRRPTSSSSSSNDVAKPQEDLMVFNETETATECNGTNNGTTPSQCGNSKPVQFDYERIRPDRKCVRNNYNLRGHTDEIILVKWNELYQKLATIDSKGNVLIWCKLNEKFTIQTPFYNRSKSVADFKWSNDGKTALICYTDSFILVGSSSGQRHWHSMLNLDDYHITCASWTPNDEQLLLGVSNGNVVVIDLPRSELIELVVNRSTIRTMCWSSCEINLSNLSKLSPSFMQENLSRRSSCSAYRRNSTVVNHRRLSRDCSVFSRYRLCSQGPSSRAASSGYTPNSNTAASSHQGNNFANNLPSTDAIGSLLYESDVSNKELNNILAIDFANNTIKLYDGGLEDARPKTIQVNLESYLMAWSSDGKILAVAGFNVYTSAPTVGCLRCRYSNAIKFYNQQGALIYEYAMKYSRYPVTAFTWAHEDRRIFVATGPRLHCAKVFFGIPTLSLLAAASLQRTMRLPDKTDVLDCLLKNQHSANVLNWQSFNCPIEISRETLSQNSIWDSILSSSENSSSLNGQSGDELSNDLARLNNNTNISRLQLPLKLKAKIDDLFAQTIGQPFDEQLSLNDIAWHVPKNQQRYYCTLVCYTSDLMDRDIGPLGHQYRTDLMDKTLDSSNSDHYKIFVLYVEFQGSLVPILRARRIGFLKPEFVIFDPEENSTRSVQRHHKVWDVSKQSCYEHFVGGQQQQQQAVVDLIHGSSSLCYKEGFPNNCTNLHSLSSDPRASSSSQGRQSISDAEQCYNFDQCDSVLKQLSNKSKNMSTQLIETKRALERYKLSTRTRGTIKSLPESSELVRIRSNIWGTKFKIINVRNRMIEQRAILGSVTYKASILHLQPRQIFLNIKDMTNYCVLCSTHHHSRAAVQLPSADKSVSGRTKPAAAASSSFSLIDAPNLETCPSTPLRGRSTRRTSQNRTRAGGDDKVVVAVGDGIRIAPKLERNQQYKFADQIPVPSTLRAHSSRHSSGGRSRRPSKDGGGLNSLSSSQRHYNRFDCSGSTTTAIAQKQHVTEERLLNNLGPVASTSRGERPENDDILTLSLNQDDQVKVEISSIATKQSSRMVVQRNEQLEGFLESNKTLKSIQTITKMIVDLSSRVANYDTSGSSDETRGYNERGAKVDNGHEKDTDTCLSPTKVLKMSGNNAARYIPPETPVHRPRRVGYRSARPLNQQLIQSQSATTTPLRIPRRLKRSSEVGAEAVRASPSDHLPAPPPSVPIGRRLSSSAKRFLDGSLRSLYSAGVGAAGGYAFHDDLEPEECEPLVTNHRPPSASTSSSRKQNSFRKLGVSQPGTPSRHNSFALDGAKQSAYLASIRSQLMQKLRATTSWMSLDSVGLDRPSGSSSASNKLSELRKTHWTYRGADGRSERRPHRGGDGSEQSSSSALDSTSSDFSSSCSSSASDDELYKSARFECVRQTAKRRFNKFSYNSTSAKNLNDLESMNPSRLEAIRGDRERRQEERRERQRRRRRRSKSAAERSHLRRRRKSICQNSNCCCAKEFQLNNRPPVWNELSQVYQLDFGGRVTQESAKNLQIDFEGNLALQFGRIDRCTYTLDYKYPFNAVQAMAIALASLTQRLK